MAESKTPKKAGVFDIRLIIALLIGGYGLVLTIMGIGFTTEEELAKAADVNINLWAGIGMLVFAALFLLWAKVRPIVVPPSSEGEGGE
ncbi:hypothetical protein [Amycolatopsis pittospori]|uniref:hypothetical protein n=1 Tax=Amycolatopsis pittospori TaxID=2749434 RepID=UPI0015F0CDD2|nr:hypothetical protein [Amycolatopsis pittospori]